MAERVTVAVEIAGQEYRVRSDGDDASVLRAAALVDETMKAIRERTASVDSLDVAVLAALNVARNLVAARQGRAGRAAAEAASGRCSIDTERIQALLSLVEGAQA